MKVELVWRNEDGLRLPALVWRAGSGWRMVSSAIVGGGVTEAQWVVNAQVPGNYGRMDPDEHLEELRARFGLEGHGVGMLTAADITKVERREDGGVVAVATVGLGVPTWAAAPERQPDPQLHQARRPIAKRAEGARPEPDTAQTRRPGAQRVRAEQPDAESAQACPPNARPQQPDAESAQACPPNARPQQGDRSDGMGWGRVSQVETEVSQAGRGWRPGTVNILVAVPAVLTDGALVNAVITATEAKTQALWEAGYDCTGTASDAVCIAAYQPMAGAQGSQEQLGCGTHGRQQPPEDAQPEAFAGPRSLWGARIARAVHAAVRQGALTYQAPSGPPEEG